MLSAFGCVRAILPCDDAGVHTSSEPYWPPSSGSAGIAMLSVHAIFEPDKQHVVEEAEDVEPLPPPPRGPH